MEVCLKSVMYILALFVVTIFGCGNDVQSNPTSSNANSTTTPDSSKETTTNSRLASSENIQLERVPVEEKSDKTTDMIGDAFQSLLRAAKIDDADLWTRSELILKDAGPAVVPILAQYLKEKDDAAREFAAMFLAQLGPDATPAADDLLPLLTDSSTFARVNAAAALSTIEGHSKQVIPVLVELLSNSDDHVRITATTSLRNFGNEAKDAVQALIARLDDEDSRVRSAAADTLGEIGNHAKNSLVHLRKLEEDHDEQVRLSVNRAIKKIDKENQTESEAIPTSATE